LLTSFDRALDVGCGTGDLARTLRIRSMYVHGVDIHEKSVTAARHLTPVTSDIEFSVVDAMDLPQSRQYDVITALAVVHHMPLAPVLRRLRDALAPGGTLVALGATKKPEPCRIMPTRGSGNRSCVVGKRFGPDDVKLVQDSLAAPLVSTGFLSHRTA
jgi:SAM-dependent methyltransferase